MSQPIAVSPGEAPRRTGGCGCCNAGMPLLLVLSGAFLGVRMAWHHGFWPRLLGLVAGLAVGYLAAALFILFVASAAVLLKKR